MKREKKNKKPQKGESVHKQYLAFHKFLRKKFNHPAPFKTEMERGEFVNAHIGELTEEEKAMFPDLIFFEWPTE